MKVIKLLACAVEYKTIDVNYELDEFANCQSEDDFVDVTFSGYTPDGGLLSIGTFNTINEFIKENPDASHLSIDFNCDHGEYEIYLYRLEFDEPKPEIKDPIEEEIKALEARLRELKNLRIQGGEDDDLPF
jgi:hypothetical protein